MKPLRIFVSYSHADQTQFEEFMTYLAPSVKQGQFELWTDRKLRPGDDWHQVIQSEVARGTVGVLLISQRFLNSAYIEQHELPPLLAAAEQRLARVVALHLEPSTVQHLEFDAGEGRKAKLTKWQGLNNPAKPLSALNEHERKAQYVEALEKLLALREPTPVAPKRGKRRPNSAENHGGRADLTVRLSVEGGDLVRRFLTAFAELDSVRSPWASVERALRGGDPTGEQLFEALFGSDEARIGKLMKSVHAVAGRSVLPTYRPVRLRIQALQPLLAAAPWSRTCWNGEMLAEDPSAWTFQLDTSSSGLAPNHESVRFQVPGPVLVLAPEGEQDPLRSRAHAASILQLLHARWPKVHGLPPHASTFAEARDRCSGRKVPFIYYYGPAEVRGDRLLLRFDGGKDGDARAVEDLLELGASAAPQLVFLNLVGSGLERAGALLGGVARTVRLAVVQTCRAGEVGIARQEFDPRITAVRWITKLLEGGADVDPVADLHQLALPSAVAWSSFEGWETPTAGPGVESEFARFLLDRRDQRAKAAEARDELLGKGKRRVIAQVGLGSEGNLMDLVGSQLHERVRADDRPVAFVRLPIARGPQAAAASVTVASLRERVLDMLQQPSNGSIRDGLSHLRSATAKGAMLFFVDFGVVGGRHAPPWSQDELREWARFCLKHLVRECPKDGRVLALLAIESEAEELAAAHAALEELSDELLSEDFRIEALPEFGPVRRIDLKTFLISGNSLCPKDRVDEAAEQIYRKTKGQFSSAVAELDRADQRSWAADVFDDWQKELGSVPKKPRAVADDGADG